MNGITMKMPISKRSFLLGAALFVLGTATGILILYGYQSRERSAHVLASAPATPQQPTPQGAAPMADMPGMSQTGSQQPKAQEPAPMAGMPETIFGRFYLLATPANADEVAAGLKP